jgi:hypothetical protein
VPELDWVGRPATVAQDPAYRQYTDTALSANLTQAEIDAQANAVYAPYASNTYWATKDLLLATQTYIDDRDNLRVPLASKDAASGVPSLDGTGKVSRSRIGQADTQRFARSFWSPAAYNSADVSVSSGESSLYSCNVTDPGFPYKLLVHGQVDTATSSDGMWPVVNVRVGAGAAFDPAGAIVASGLGPATSSAWFGGDYFTRTTTTGTLGGPNYWTESTIGPGTDGNPYCNGSEATWDVAERNIFGPNTGRRRMLYRKAGADALTGDDWQEVTVVVGSTTAKQPTLFGWGASNYIYGRISLDGAQYVAWRWNWNSVTLIFSETEVAQVTSFTQAPGDVLTARFGTSAGKRYYQFLKNGTSVINYNDATSSAALGNRGWGIGVEAGEDDNLFGAVRWQTTPSSFAQVLVNDLPPTSVPTWRQPATVRPVGFAAQPARTGATTLWVSVTRSSAAGTATGGNYLPNLRVEAVPA